MPIYVFECPRCGSRQEKSVPMKDRDKPQLQCANVNCSRGYPMKRIIVKPNIQEDIEPYWDENLTNDATESGGYFCPSYDDRDHKLDGVFIKSRRQKRELMKRWGYEYRN